MDREAWNVLIALSGCGRYHTIDINLVKAGTMGVGLLTTCWSGDCTIRQKHWIVEKRRLFKPHNLTNHMALHQHMMEEEAWIKQNES